MKKDKKFTKYFLIAGLAITLIAVVYAIYSIKVALRNNESNLEGIQSELNEANYYRCLENGGIGCGIKPNSLLNPGWQR